MARGCKERERGRLYVEHGKKQGFNVLAQICLLPLGAAGGAIGVALRFGLKGALGSMFSTASGKRFAKESVFHFKGGKYKSWSYQ